MVIIATMVKMTPVLTLTATDAAAQGVPPDCDLGYVVDPATNTCVEDTGQDGQLGPGRGVPHGAPANGYIHGTCMSCSLPGACWSKR